MGKLPKKIETPSWLNVNDYKWSAKYKILHGVQRLLNWETEKKLFNLLRKEYPNVFHHVFFVDGDDNTKVIPFEYDFYIPDHGIVIEYNGKEHYDPLSVYHDDIFAFIKQVDRDVKKINYILSKGLKYVPISYDQALTLKNLRRYIDDISDIDDIVQHYVRRYASCLQIEETNLLEEIYKKL